MGQYCKPMQRKLSLSLWDMKQRLWIMFSPNAEDNAMIEEGFEKKKLHGIKKMLYIGLKKFDFQKEIVYALFLK